MTEYPSVMPHGPIELVADDVFWVRGSIGLGPGLRITRNMAIVRSGGELSLFHTVRLSPEGQAELEKLGVRFAVFHRNGYTDREWGALGQRAEALAESLLLVASFDEGRVYERTRSRRGS